MYVFEILHLCQLYLTLMTLAISITYISFFERRRHLHFLNKNELVNDIYNVALRHNVY
jgi:hypothetical protein